MISVIVPVYNEKESVAMLHAELVAELESLGHSFEIIMVNDGSTDGTITELKKLKPLHLISFARNFGKSQALQAGFNAAKGEYIFTIDGDLQDDPREIRQFINKIEEGPFDLVCGWKKNRLDSFSKKTVSRIANSITRFLTGIKVHDMNCGFKLYRKEVAKTLHLYGDMHRYIPAIIATQGFSIAEIPIHHRERKFGISKYGNFRRFFRSFFDFITLLLLRRFVDRPMHLFGIMGTMSSIVGFLTLTYLAYIRLFEGGAIGNRPLLLLGILLVVIGIQLFSLGFLGELVIRQSINKQVYNIQEEIE